MKQILNVLVGSQAHGLADENSDFDYRGVFVALTTDILKIGGSVKHTSWQEGKVDDTSWEVGHFLNLAVHSNPTILETLLSPIQTVSSEGKDLLQLFPAIWNSKDVYNAFSGYGRNQQKKFLDGKDGRPHKFAVAYLRVLYQGWQLLQHGIFCINMQESPIYETLKNWKKGEYEIGEVVQTCYEWDKKLKTAYDNNPDKQTDLETVNNFLIQLRKNNF